MVLSRCRRAEGVWGELHQDADEAAAEPGSEPLACCGGHAGARLGWGEMVYAGGCGFGWEGARAEEAWGGGEEDYCRGGGNSVCSWAEEMEVAGLRDG